MMKKHGKEAQWYSNAELMFADTSALLAGHVCCCNKSQLYTTDPAPTNTSISTTHSVFVKAVVTTHTIWLAVWLHPFASWVLHKMILD